MKNADMPAMSQYAWNDAAEKFTATGGLTKREMFAMAAMQGLLSSQESAVVFQVERRDSESGYIAELATRHADALLSELAKECNHDPAR
jgi:hypothetical protein